MLGGWSEWFFTRCVIVEARGSNINIMKVPPGARPDLRESLDVGEFFLFLSVFTAL